MALGTHPVPGAASDQWVPRGGMFWDLSEGKGETFLVSVLASGRNSQVSVPLD